jgi:hypothetical protein
MPCLVVLLAIAAPRVTIVVLYFFTTWFRGIFDTALWPVLGFFFLPATLLWYTAVQHWWGGQWSLWPIVGIVIALMIDVSPAKHRRRPRRSSEE